MSTTTTAFKINEPNFVQGSGPDTTLIPTQNLPEFLETAVLTCPYATIHWFNVEKCPSRNGVVYLLQASASIDIIAPSYPFELSIPSANVSLQSQIITGNFAVSGANTTYNANQFVTIQTHRPGFVAFELSTQDIVPIVSTPTALSLNLNFF